MEINGFLGLLIAAYWVVGFFFSIYLGHWFIRWSKKCVENKLLDSLEKKYRDKSISISCEDRKKALGEIISVKADISIKEPTNGITGSSNSSKINRIKRRILNEILHPVLNESIGFFERIFFTLLTAVNPSAVPAPMVIWIGVKIVQNWQASKPEKSIVSASIAFCSWSFSVLSITFAFVGGLICNAWRLHF